MKKLILILDNIRSTYNVGAILRTCDGLAVDKVIFSGYTPFFDKGLAHERDKLRRQIHKTALGAESSVAWSRSDDLLATIASYRSQSFQIVALEQGSGSLNLADSSSIASVKEADLVLILGEERFGISKEILSACDHLLEIPMLGKKESFNVSVAAAIAVWELRKPSLRCQN